MSITKNQIPILEFDSDKHAVIEPHRREGEAGLPELAVFAFLRDHLESYAESVGARKVSEFLSATKIYPVYVSSYNGKEVCLMQAPVGAAPSAQILDWLIGCGVRKIIACGCCGALTDLPEGVFLIPKRALRDEGTSYHYAPPSRFIEIDGQARTAIEDAMGAKGIKYTEVVTWTTDGFYRETREKVEYRKSEGCTVVEMECSALAACAALRGAVFGMIFYTADSLADVSNYDERNWGAGSEDIVIRLSLEAVTRI